MNVPNVLAENAETYMVLYGIRFFFKFLNDYYDIPSRSWTFASGLIKQSYDPDYIHQSLHTNSHRINH
ncbi:hypothetical protein [Peribacillus frigoritolerans]|uniref:hypothetical protein n=1 Tax=Peribacillus frigoritolerans TaxID=450367 RepID=UPI000FD816A8|nr:hypothetical protein [Peribacillus frigoritolerans]AZV61660.1 hypothetical protein DOZ91_14250 [Peribacillus frigoritolerans]